MKQRDKGLYNRPLKKSQKIDLLLSINYMNAGKILMARDFYFQLMIRYPDQSRQFSSPVEIGKLLEQTSIEAVKQSDKVPKIYLCGTEAKRIYF